MERISQNLKKLRLQKKLTQEQVAEALGVSSQTISRWECNTTYPDITLLPEIARLYCVTIDDLFQENTQAYDNYAQRLASVYETSHKPEDYISANYEFNKLKQANEYTHKDSLKHGMIHLSMSLSCKQLAAQCFQQIIDSCEKDGNISPSNTIYWSTRYHNTYLHISSGDPLAVCKKQAERTKKCIDNYMEWTVLIYAYYYSGKNMKAYETFKKALEKFTDKWELFMVAGYVCKALKRYDEAIEYCNKAYELSNEYMDALYTKVFCLQEIGDYRQAYTTWQQIIQVLRKEGFDVEAQREEQRAQSCLEKAKNIP